MCQTGLSLGRFISPTMMYEVSGNIFIRIGSLSWLESAVFTERSDDIKWRYSDIASLLRHLTGQMIVCSKALSDWQQRHHQSFELLALCVRNPLVVLALCVRNPPVKSSLVVLALCVRNPPVTSSPVDSPHKGPVMWKVFPCHDVTMDTKNEIWHHPSVMRHKLVA